MSVCDIGNNEALFRIWLTYNIAIGLSLDFPYQTGGIDRYL